MYVFPNRGTSQVKLFIYVPTVPRLHTQKRRGKKDTQTEKQKPRLGIPSQRSRIPSLSFGFRLGAVTWQSTWQPTWQQMRAHRKAGEEKRHKPKTEAEARDPGQRSRIPSLSFGFRFGAMTWQSTWQQVGAHRKDREGKKDTNRKTEGEARDSEPKGPNPEPELRH